MGLNGLAGFAMAVMPLSGVIPAYIPATFSIISCDIDFNTLSLVCFPNKYSV